MKGKILLVAILLIASALRLSALDKHPVSLFGDEVDVGYHAYSLLITGEDYMGQTLPLYIHSLAEWRAPLFIYSAVPSIALFGLNEWGVRIPAAFFGILGIYLFYKLGSLQDKRLGIIGALLLAIMPWHIHYSRAAFEVTLLLCLLLGGLLAYVNKKFILAGALFALTPYVYSTAAVFTPLYVFWLLLSQRKLNKNVVKFSVVFGFLLLPYIYLTMLGPAAGRFSLLSIFNSEQLINNINIERNETGDVNERIFHNKIIGWGEVFLTNYTKSFSPEFLFISGDPSPRHNLPGLGQLQWGLLPILLSGIYLGVKNRGEFNKYWFAWLLLAPIPAALTIDGGQHATRLFLMIPPLIYFCAQGLARLAAGKSKLARVFIFGVSTIVILNTVWFLHRYTTHYPLQNWKYWHYGYKQAVQSLAANQDQYTAIFINNTYEPSLLHFLFWTKYSPAKFHQEFTGDVPKEGIYPGFDGFVLGNKFYFGETKNLFSLLDKNSLYLAAQQKEIPGDWDFEKSTPQGMKILKVVRNPQDQPLFSLVTKE